jgi:hypothetical protein
MGQRPFAWSALVLELLQTPGRHPLT